MHEMIDRVADLLMSRGCGDREQCEESARAVIKVMREPTEDMFMSGGNAEPYNRSQTGRARPSHRRPPGSLLLASDDRPDPVRQRSPLSRGWVNNPK